MLKKTRINLAAQIAADLENTEWDLGQAILMTYGLPVRPELDGPSLIEIVASASDDQITELAEHFEIAQPSAPAPELRTVARTVDPLFVFASHLSQHRVLVNEVSNALLRYGILLFVAHDSIPNDAAWQDEIEKGLDRADAGLVFYHSGLRDSQWCDQEVGWLLGRHVPVLGLRFDCSPYGPAGRLQAPSVGNLNAVQIADSTLNRLLSMPELRAGLATSLVLGMEMSSSFYTTDNVWLMLRDFDSLDANQCAVLLNAVKTNSQVHGAEARHDGRKAYFDVIPAWLRKQPGGATISSDIDAFEKFVAANWS